MKIYFSNVNFSSNSGPNTFASRLANQFTIKGHNIVESHVKHYDIFLCFIETLIKPRPSSKFIQRLDGIWFKPGQFETHNKNIKWAYENCSHVVWQSEFDRNMTQHHWGMKNGSVIHNGIDFKVPDTKVNYTNIKDLKLQTSGRIFVTSASWHRQKRLKENIHFFLKNRNEDDLMLVLGKDPDFFIDNPEISKKIIYTGQLSHSQCLEIYKHSDWMIHLAWLDHCPNVVVEALSQGCPVICTDSGGTKEIVKENGIIIPEQTSYALELTDYDMPYRLNIPKINLIKPTMIFDYLDIEKVANKYLEIMK
jgi:glycosyltransferase involved in cell wall biosynthesis